MTDKQILNKVREWLILNVRHDIDGDLVEDNKALLKAIKEWKNDSKRFN